MYGWMHELQERMSEWVRDGKKENFIFLPIYFINLYIIIITFSIFPSYTCNNNNNNKNNNNIIEK